MEPTSIISIVMGALWFGLCIGGPIMLVGWAMTVTGRWLVRRYGE